VVYWYNYFMRNNLFKIIGGIIIGCIVIGVVIFFSGSDKTDQDILVVPVQTENITEEQKETVDYSAENDHTAERLPKRFACVGEYCDGSMSGESNFTVVKVPLVTDGGTIGCGAKIFFAPHTVPKTVAVVDATYKLLFDIKPLPEIAADGFRNVVGNYTQLWYDHVIVSSGVAKLYLTGTMYGPGHCAEPELREQIDQAAFQFDTINKIEVYINNKLFDWCSMSDADPSESGCDKNPKYWIDSK
jgi:hypothetical protein